MDNNKRTETVLLGFLRRRMTEIMPDQIRACVAELTDEQLWWRANDDSNSVGNLILHLCGSTRHYFCRSMGGFKYERNRSLEFSERGPMPREELLKVLDETIKEAVATFDSFDPSRLMEPSEEPAYYPTLLEQILGIGTHFSTHTGQIVFATKLLNQGSIKELWMKAHKQTK